MTNQEFSEFYKKNKVVVIGVPIILVVMLVNQFVLKPAREARRLALLGKPVASGTVSVAAAPVPDAGAKEPAAMVAPPPLANDFSMVPLLDKRIETRLMSDESYPYGETKNIFNRPKKESEPVLMVDAPVVQEEKQTFERPDISYHGFFSVGPDKIAILKLSERLMLTKAGHSLIDTPFVLQTVFPDRVILSDTQEGDRQFEITLNDGTEASTKDSAQPLAGR